MDGRRRERATGSARYLRGRRLARPVAFLLLAILLLPQTSATAGTACPPLVSKDWTTITVPEFQEGQQRITAYAVSPTDPRIVFVTNGSVVLVTRDGGCNFSQSFALGSADLSYDLEGAKINALHLASKDGHLAYLAIEATERIQLTDLPDPLGLNPDAVPVGIRPHVLVTKDGGDSWQEADAGLEEAFGAPLDLGGAYDSETVYLLVDRAKISIEANVEISRPQRFFASSNAGGQWGNPANFGAEDVATNPPPPAGKPTDPGPSYEFITGDPLTPTEVWVYGSGGLLQSTDGGTNFATPGLFSDPGPVSEVEVEHSQGQPPQVIVLMDSVATAYYSGSDPAALAGFRPWVSQPVPVISDSAALAPRTFPKLDPTDPVHCDASGCVHFGIGTIAGDTYYFHTQSQAPEDLSIQVPIRDLQASASGDQQLLYGRTERTLVRRLTPPPQEYNWDPPEPIPSPPLDPIELPDNLQNIVQPKLAPAHRELAMFPGETRVIPWTLWLPGITKLDIAFLMDESGSMDEEINGLRQAAAQIFTDIRNSDIDACYGVSGYLTYDSSIIYDRYTEEPALACEEEQLEGALGQLGASGGGNTEATLGALYQIATGYGQPAPDFIEADQGIPFRQDAVKVIVHGTDEKFHYGPPNPDLSTVVGELNARNIQQVGLAYQAETEGAIPNPEFAGDPTDSLKDMAARTKAFVQGTNSVDCDGDPGPELTAGMEIVCAIPPGDADEMTTSIGKAIVNIAKAIPDIRSLTMTAEGDDSVVTDIYPDQYPGVDFKIAQGWPFFTTVECVTPGEHHVEFVVSSRGAPLASATLDLSCYSIPRAAKEGRPPPGIPPIFPPTNPPPGPHVQVQSPVQQIQAQQQGQQQAQAQAGLVTQRQEQPQVAAVKVMKPTANLAKAGGEGGEDLSFSRYRKREADLPAYLPSYVIAAAFGAAFGLVLRKQARRAYVTTGATRGRYR